MAGLASRLIGRVKRRSTPQESFRQGLQGLLQQAPQQASQQAVQTKPLIVGAPQQAVPTKPLYQAPQSQPQPQIVSNVAAPYGTQLPQIAGRAPGRPQPSFSLNNLFQSLQSRPGVQRAMRVNRLFGRP